MDIKSLREISLAGKPITISSEEVRSLLSEFDHRRMIHAYLAHHAGVNTGRECCAASGRVAEEKIMSYGEK